MQTINFTKTTGADSTIYIIAAGDVSFHTTRYPQYIDVELDGDGLTQAVIRIYGALGNRLDVVAAIPNISFEGIACIDAEDLETKLADTFFSGEFIAP